MDRDHGCRARAAIIGEIGGGQPRLPIMPVHNAGPKLRTFPQREASRDLAKRSEPEGIIRPIKPIRSHIGATRTREEMRSIEHEKVEPSGVCTQHLGATTEKVRLDQHGLGSVDLAHHCRISRNERHHRDTFGGKRPSKRAGNIGKAPGLDQRIDFRNDREDRDLAHAPSLSIICWVMRTIPSPVRRNRLASASISSPTTRPSGIFTPRSITTLVSRAARAIST